MRLLLCSLVLFFSVMVSCAPKRINKPNLSGLADTTDECKYMDRVCREAEEFQREFNSFSEEAQNELVPALNGYVDNCERAAELCTKSLD